MGSKKGPASECLTYIRAWQRHPSAFFLSARDSDPQISRYAKIIKSALDRKADLTLRTSGNQPGNKVLVLGIDGVGTTPVQGAPSSMESRLCIAMQQHALARGDFHIVRVDEYFTSRGCPECLAYSQVNTVVPMKKMPRCRWYGDQDRLDKEGKIAMIRIRYCPHSETIFHRDTMAANNIDMIPASILQYGERPSCFVRRQNALHFSSSLV